MELFQEDEFCNHNPLYAVSISIVEMDLLGKTCMNKNTKKVDSLLTFE